MKDFTLVMEVSQDSKDAYILTSIQKYFGTGKVYHEIRLISKYRLAIREEIIDKLVPHFINYPLGPSAALLVRYSGLLARW